MEEKKDDAAEQERLKAEVADAEKKVGELRDKQER